MTDDLIKRLTTHDKDCALFTDPPRGDCDCHVAYVGADAAAALEAYRKEGWQPIETAPKDGTPILLGAEPNEDGPFSIILGCWYKDGWYCWTPEKHIWPTHWMPLPQSPK